MGRKQTLRRERQRKMLVNKTKQNLTVATDADANADVVKEKQVVYYGDDDFPKSDFFVQGQRMFEEQNHVLSEEIIDKYMRGATEYGCVYSMRQLGVYYSDPVLNGNFIHLAQPWFLEAAIRGSFAIDILIGTIYAAAKPVVPHALKIYWMEMYYTNALIGSSRSKDVKIKEHISGNIKRVCAICAKTDTPTFTLQQCMGCSTYCYCGEQCQAAHWADHRAECKQIQILKKYHKPYAKEIRKAAIRGETHPALEKLRSKLGLTRPIEEYYEFHNMSKPIDPRDYVVARNDGTVWVGSTNILTYAKKISKEGNGSALNRCDKARDDSGRIPKSILA